MTTALATPPVRTTTGFEVTLISDEADSTWKAVTVRDADADTARVLAQRVLDDGYDGMCQVSYAHAAARLVDRWDRVFRIGPWRRADDARRA